LFWDLGAEGWEADWNKKMDGVRVIVDDSASEREGTSAFEFLDLVTELLYNGEE
jgi:hypothetical protein